MPRKKDATPAKSEKESALDRAERGDEEAAALIRQTLTPEKMAGLASIVRTAERSVIDRMMGKNLLARDSTCAQLAVLKADVGGPAPSPLERLLVDRIALCWLEVQYFETLYAQNMGEMTMAQGDSQQRRIDAAHRRYLSSIRTLAQVRRLAVPAIQVNIGEKQLNQVNVAAPGPVQAPSPAP